MEQMKIDPEMQVPVDYENDRLTRNIKLFRPTVYKEGDAFCCLLGPDPTTGIFGSGPDPEAAMLDWENHLNDYIHERRPGDPLTDYVLDMLTTSKDNVW
jgi:hypothetical protein